MVSKKGNFFPCSLSLSFYFSLSKFLSHLHLARSLSHSPSPLILSLVHAHSVSFSIAHSLSSLLRTKSLEKPWPPPPSPSLIFMQVPILPQHGIVEFTRRLTKDKGMKGERSLIIGNQVRNGIAITSMCTIAKG